MNILLTIQQTAHAHHPKDQFTVLKFIVDGEGREATPAELMRHGFHVPPDKVDLVADAVSAKINADAHEAVVRNLQRRTGRAKP